MLYQKYNNMRYLPLLTILLLFINSIICQQTSQESLIGRWGEKIITEDTPDFDKNMKVVENHLISEGYSLEKTNIIPIGFFKQIVNGINYRIICAVKKKSDDSPTIFDIFTHKSNNEIKMISSKNPEYSSIKLSEKSIDQMKIAIIKYYFEKLYTIKNFEIEYEYHNLDGLYDYAIYDVKIELENKDENVNKRVLIIYRNDRTFTVETELERDE